MKVSFRGLQPTVEQQYGRGCVVSIVIDAAEKPRLEKQLAGLRGYVEVCMEVKNEPSVWQM